MAEPHSLESPSAQQRKANLRLGLILAAVAFGFGFAFIARIIWFGGI